MSSTILCKGEFNLACPSSVSANLRCSCVAKVSIWKQLQISEVDDGIPLLITTDGDGDAFAIGTLSLGRILQSWSKTMDSVDEGVNLDNIYLRPIKQLPSWLRNNIYMIRLCKIVAAQGLHVAHHASVTQPFLASALFMPPRNKMYSRSFSLGLFERCDSIQDIERGIK